MENSSHRLQLSPRELAEWVQTGAERAEIIAHAKRLLGRVGTKIDFDRLDKQAFEKIQRLVEDPEKAVAGRGFLEWHTLQRQPQVLRRSYT